MIKKIPGTKDILPNEVSWWQEIEKISRNIFSLYNYLEIRPPLIEETALFIRSLGGATEIVKKQMFLIGKDKGAYALRPEGTASIVRAYIENYLYKTQQFIKLYYLGPMFRRERPQKGRLRQFHHIGCEVIGAQDPLVDAEVISLADKLLGAYSIKDYEIKLNSLGCAEDKKKLAQILRDSLKDKVKRLCPDCRDRYRRNILRILDCKNDACKEIIKKINIQDAHLCPECKSHFVQVKAGLDRLGVDYALSPHLVRGLDYYTRTVFEIAHKDLGAQDALGAGGRYDNLVNDLGGPDVGAIGFAFGMERLCLVSSIKCQVSSRGLVYLISLGDKARAEAFKLLDHLRQSGIACDTDYENKSLKGAMRKANDLGCRFVVIVGEDELNKGVVTLKDMNSGQQQEIKPEDLSRALKGII
jgi:histidyl-tRNA synthetase